MVGGQEIGVPLSSAAYPDTSLLKGSLSPGRFLPWEQAHGRVQDGERCALLLESGTKTTVKGGVAMDGQEGPAGPVGILRQLCRHVQGHVSGEDLNTEALIAVPTAPFNV